MPIKNMEIANLYSIFIFIYKNKGKRIHNVTIPAIADGTPIGINQSVTGVILFNKYKYGRVNIDKAHDSKMILCFLASNGTNTAHPNAIDKSEYAAHVICRFIAISTIKQTPAATKQVKV
jgi:hypothetical protein